MHCGDVINILHQIFTKMKTDKRKPRRWQSGENDWRVGKLFICHVDSVNIWFELFKKLMFLKNIFFKRIIHFTNAIIVLGQHYRPRARDAVRILEKLAPLAESISAGFSLFFTSFSSPAEKGTDVGGVAGETCFMMGSKFSAFFRVGFCFGQVD